MAKEYVVSDLFFTRWEDLSVKKHVEVYALQQMITACIPPSPSGPSGEGRGEVIDSLKYGVTLISILRKLRKRPLLVDKINVEQAVDIYNDLKFLNEPWYNFPEIRKMKTPDEKMARHTLDQFIYADNEYSSFLISREEKFLRRLLATLYMQEFDKELVEPVSNKLKVKDYELTMVFFTYAQVRDFVTKRCKTLLPKSAAGENSKAAPTGAMWLKLKHRLAETPAFQGYDNAGHANMYSALDYLEDLAQIKERNAKK